MKYFYQIPSSFNASNILRTSKLSGSKDDSLLNNYSFYTIL